MKRALPLLLAVTFAACFAFEDAVIPERRAPAILLANMRLLGSGVFQVDGSLTPGREETGLLRIVQVPQIHASEFVAEPLSRDDRGVHTYQSAFAVAADRAAAPFQLVAPAVRGTTPPPPVLFHGLQRLDPDTLRLAPATDIVLRLDTVPLPSQPAQRTRQWFVEVRGGSSVFRLSGDGAPPPALRIPFDWVGAPAGGSVAVSLIYMQSAQVRVPDDSYIVNALLDHRMQWTVLYEALP